MTRYWWVNNNRWGRLEIQGGYLWCPKRNTDGAFNPFYENMTRVEQGDVIFAYVGSRIAALGVAQGRAEEAERPTERAQDTRLPTKDLASPHASLGWRILVEYRQLDSPIRPKEHIHEIKDYLESSDSPLPLRPTGDGKQNGYLFEVPTPLAQKLIEIIARPADIDSEKVEVTPKLFIHDDYGDSLDSDFRAYRQGSHVVLHILSYGGSKPVRRGTQMREGRVIALKRIKQHGFRISAILTANAGQKARNKAWVPQPSDCIVRPRSAGESINITEPVEDWAKALWKEAAPIAAAGANNFDRPLLFFIETDSNPREVLDAVLNPVPVPDLPEQVSDVHTLVEGSAHWIWINAYERNPKARADCLEHYGFRCTVCDFDFAEAYGERGNHFIVVHHLKPLSELRQEYVVDPIADLRPVCPNCHAMLHRTNPPCSIEELQEMIRQLGRFATLSET